jgi:hypothetical protein
MEAGVTAQQYTAEAAAVAPAGEEEADDAVRMEQERVRRLIQTIRATPPEGRMVIRIRPVDELRGTADDVELDGEDQLVIPRKPDEVNVIGAVLNQTALLYREGLTVWDYVLQCGGPSASADVGLVFVIRADGTADSSQSIRHRYRWDTSRGRFSRGSLMASELAPGDTVIVPHDLKPKLSKLGLTTAITQIIFQAAMATGVVVALL